MAGKKNRAREAMGEIPKKDAKNLRNLVQLADEKKALPRKIVEPLPPPLKKLMVRPLSLVWSMNLITV